MLLFPLSGAPLFLPSGLGFQSGGSLVLWLGGSGGWGGRVRGGGAGFYEVVRLEVRLEGEWVCDAVSLGQKRT